MCEYGATHLRVRVCSVALGNGVREWGICVCVKIVWVSVAGVVVFQKGRTPILLWHRGILAE